MDREIAKMPSVNFSIDFAAAVDLLPVSEDTADLLQSHDDGQGGCHNARQTYFVRSR